MADHDARHADPTIEAELLMYPEDAAHDPLDTPAPVAAPLSAANVKALRKRLAGAGLPVHSTEIQSLCDSHEALRTALSEARAERDARFDIRSVLAEYTRRKSVAVLDQNWERAADLRDVEYRLEKIVKELSASAPPEPATWSRT